MSGNGYQVDVIRHQTEAENRQFRSAGGGGEQVEAGVTVLVVEEHLTPEVSSLGDMVRAANGHDSLNASHHPYSGRDGEKFSPNLEVG